MSDEMDFFIFLLEMYAKEKGRSAGDVLKEWESKGITNEIYNGYFQYHQEALINAINDIDRIAAAAKPAKAAEVTTS